MFLPSLEAWYSHSVLLEGIFHPGITSCLEAWICWISDLCRKLSFVFFFPQKELPRIRQSLTQKKMFTNILKELTLQQLDIWQNSLQIKKKRKKERTGSPSIHSAVHFALGFYFRSLMKCTYFPNLKICLRLVIDNEKVESLLWLDYTKHEILLKPFSLISNFNHFTSSPSIYLQIFINTKYSR